MKTHSPSRPGFLHKARRAVFVLRVLALCANSATYAQVHTPAQPPQSAVTPEQKFAPGYLEAVSTGYENGQAMHDAEGVAPLRPQRPAVTRTDVPVAPVPMAETQSVSATGVQVRPMPAR
jgi:hypothetical protein